MNRFKSVVAGAVVVAALASGAAAVFAQGSRGGALGIGGPGGPGGRGGRDGGPGLPLRGLNLTDAQEQQIRDIRQQEREGMRDLQARVRAASEAHHAAVESVPVNEGLIRQTTEALANVQAEVAIRQAHVYNQVWAVLTKEQQAQAATLRAQREARQKDRVENRRQR
jgi:Spy/CpxP family protein refolding chaperone